MKKITSALLSVFYKDGLEELLAILAAHEVKLFSTGGTLNFIQSLGYQVTSVESVTGFPEMLDGRVKTLHPAVFGGILARRQNVKDLQTLAEFSFPVFDLVVVNLYPFEETVAKTSDELEIIEKIDIGGVSLIRAAAKNFTDVAILSQLTQYASFVDLLKTNACATSLDIRKQLAIEAFANTCAYDQSIARHFAGSTFNPRIPLQEKRLRYGENPHQKGAFYGNLDDYFEQLHGKEISFNNLTDAEAALSIIRDISENIPAFVIVKHTNACGVAFGDTVKQAYQKALASDPVSAFGGILASSHAIDKEAAETIDSLFFEILAAPAFEPEAFELLSKKKNRILLKTKTAAPAQIEFKSLFNGVLVQDKDKIDYDQVSMNAISTRKPEKREWKDLLLAEKIAMHTKSNTIVLVKNEQLVASGTGQTSRVDALRQAIDKAEHFGLDLNGAVMASDAFFPFPDCVEIAHQAGISAVIHPGGSIKDQDSIDYCNANELAMVITGKRHFKH